MSLLEARNRWSREATFHGILNEFAGSTAEEFFDTGRETVNEVLARAEDFQRPKRFHRALDFGCGMGRLTRALADHFDHAVGVDISPRMIFLAKDFDPLPEYLLMEKELPPLEPVDFLLSMFVLQHMPPDFAAWYLARFPDLLTEGGIGAVQASLPSEDGGLQDETAREVLGDRLLAVDTQDGWANPDVISYTYWFRG